MRRVVQLIYYLVTYLGGLAVLSRCDVENDEHRSWRQGRVLAFDDSLVHQATRG